MDNFWAVFGIILSIVSLGWSIFGVIDPQGKIPANTKKLRATIGFSVFTVCIVIAISSMPFLFSSGASPSNGSTTTPDTKISASPPAEASQLPKWDTQNLDQSFIKTVEVLATALHGYNAVIDGLPAVHVLNPAETVTCTQVTLDELDTANYPIDFTARGNDANIPMFWCEDLNEFIATKARLAFVPPNWSPEDAVVRSQAEASTAVGQYYLEKIRKTKPQYSVRPGFSVCVAGFGLKFLGENRAYVNRMAKALTDVGSWLLRGYNSSNGTEVCHG